MNQAAEAVAPSATINNVVATAKIVGSELNLPEIARKANNVRYTPKNSKGPPGLKFQLRGSQVQVNIYASGNVKSNGGSTEAEAKREISKVKILLCRMGYPVKLTQFKVVNMTASCDVNFPVSLETFAQEYPLFAYIRAALDYRMNNPKVTVSVYRSGKLTVAGAKGSEEVQQAVNKIYPLLVPHRLPDAPSAAGASAGAATVGTAGPLAGAAAVAAGPSHPVKVEADAQLAAATAAGAGGPVGVKIKLAGNTEGAATACNAPPPSP